MASYKIWWKASTKEVKVLREGETAPAGFVDIKTVTHDGETDPISEYGDGHVIYHHVRDALFEEGITNMQSISIVAFDQIINVTAISVAPPTANLSLSGVTTQQLTTTFTPATPDNVSLTYVSSDPTKATVSNTGLVTAVAVGEATITVTSVDGGFTDTCVVTVVA